MRVAESYQPASHYWPLQLAETGFFLILALVLVLLLAAQPQPMPTNGTSLECRSPAGALLAKLRRAAAPSRWRAPSRF